MPPKTKISKSDIVEAALEIVRREGYNKVNARSIAANLECSTQPVFSNFENMDALFDALMRSAYDRYLGFIVSECEKGKYPKYKSFGMAYIRFAREERELFKLLFMFDRSGGDMEPTPDYTESVRLITEMHGLSWKRAELMHLEMWSFTHGIGTMIATSFLELDDELISVMLSDAYHGILSRHLSEEAKNGSN